MAKYCFNYESGQYERITENGFSETQGENVNNWDKSPYEQKNEEGENREEHSEKTSSFNLGREMKARATSKFGRIKSFPFRRP